MKLHHSAFGLTVILFSCSTYLLGRSNSIKDEIEKNVSVPADSSSKIEPEPAVILEPKKKAEDEKDDYLNHWFIYGRKCNKICTNVFCEEGGEKVGPSLLPYSSKFRHAFFDKEKKAFLILPERDSSFFGEYFFLRNKTLISAQSDLQFQIFSSEEECEANRTVRFVIRQLCQEKVRISEITQALNDFGINLEEDIDKPVILAKKEGADRIKNNTVDFIGNIKFMQDFCKNRG